MKPGGIFALDIGSKASGHAYGCPGDTPVWGHRGFIDVEPGGDAGIFYAFSSWLNSQFEETGPAYFVYEPMWVSPHIAAVRRLLGMEAIALSVARLCRLKIRDYPIKTVAQFHGNAGLKSKAKKRITRENIEQRYGWAPVTLDEADALALWLFAESQLEPRSRRCVGPLFTPSREVIDSR